MMLFGVLFTVLFGVAISVPQNKIASTNNFTQDEDGGADGTDNNDISDQIDESLEKHLIEYISTHDVSVGLPFLDSVVKLDSRKLDSDELNLKIKYNAGSEFQARKKSKIKKIFIPILVFILLKAMTLIPLALGVLGIKTWNAIQLSFISFVSALALAVWKLSSKVNHDYPPQIIHNAWDPHHIDRSGEQTLPYSAYAPQ